MAQTSLKQHFNSFILLSALLLLGCARVTLSNSNTVQNEASNVGVDAKFNRRTERQTWFAKDEDGRSEERVPGAEKLHDLIKSGATKLKNIGKETLNFNIQKATEDSVAKLGVGAVESKGTNTALDHSVTTVKNKIPVLNEDAFLPALTAQYGEEALTKLLVTAQRPGTSQVATMVNAIQFDSWVSKKKTAGDIYNLLKLNAKDANVLVNPLLPTWISFVKTKLKEDPYDILLLNLVKQYEEDALHKILMVASAKVTTRDIANGLEHAQIKKWLTSGKAEDDVLKLSLVPADKDLEFLKHPALETFISYATKHDTVDPYEFLVLKLAKRHGEDELPKMLVKAKSDFEVKDMAVKMEAAQFKIWKDKGKTSDDVFKMLRLDTDQGNDMLKNPALASWFAFVESSSQNPIEALYHKLKTRFSDEEILQIRFTLRSDQGRAVSLSRLDEAMENHWLSQQKTAEDIFTDLSLHKDGTTLFHNPLLPTWSSYLRTVHKEEADSVMLSVMSKFFGDEGLEKIIDLAKHSTQARTYKGIVKRVEKEMRRDGKTTDGTLNLRGRAEDVLLDPSFATWVYRFQNKERYQDEFAIISALAKQFGDDINFARALSDAKTKLLQSGKTADTIKALQSLQFKQWMQRKHWIPEEIALFPHFKDSRYVDVYLGFLTFYKSARGS